jgi:hypothetical protein
MFEETVRALRRLGGQTEVAVPIDDDEDGYLDRECPSEECLFHFKVVTADWIDKVQDEAVFCPNCGHTAPSGNWWTQEQIAHAREAVFAQIKGAVKGALNKDAVRWNRSQPRNNFISMTMKVDSRPQHVPLPPAAAEPMRLKIACPACDCRYAVIGAAYFCPACGHNSADQQFDLTIAGIRQSLAAVGAVRAAISDRDTAESTVRLIVESGLQHVVTAFQRCAEALYAGLPASTEARRNAFQSLGEGDLLWKEATGRTYADHLSEEQFAVLRRAFQQRHLLAHTQGIVDQDYITKSGDVRYRPGQRIVVRAEAVQEALTLIVQLVAGMLADVKGGSAKRDAT